MRGHGRGSSLPARGDTVGRCRSKIASPRSAPLSPSPAAGSSTATAAASTTRVGRSAAPTTASDGSPAGSSFAAGCAGRCCNRAGSPSCSSSTRRPRSRPGTARVLSAAATTTCACSPSGRSSTPGRSGAERIDERLHDERLSPLTRTQLHHRAPLGELPDGCFVLHRGSPHLVFGRRLLRWTSEGYTAPLPGPGPSEAVVITPPSLVSLLADGWSPAVPLLHPSALCPESSARPSSPRCASMP